MFIDIVYASSEAASEAVETAVESGLLASLGINGQLFVFQLINFAVVAAILWFLILKPITKKMTERQNLIDESIDNAHKIQDNLQKSEQKYQERVDEAKVDANKIIEKAGNEALELSAGVREKSKKEIEVLVEHAKRNIKTEKELMVAELKAQTAELVVLALEKLLSEKIDVKKDGKLIEEALADLKK